MSAIVLVTMTPQDGWSAFADHDGLGGAEQDAAKVAVHDEVIPTALSIDRCSVSVCNCGDGYFDPHIGEKSHGRKLLLDLGVPAG